MDIFGLFVLIKKEKNELLVFLSILFSLGVELFSTGLGDLYYPSNDMDPYLQNEDVSFFFFFPLKRYFLFFYFL